MGTETLEGYLGGGPTAADAPPLVARGEGLMAAGRPAEALESFELAVSADIRSAGAHMGCGHAHFALGRPARALESFRCAAMLGPLGADAHTCCGVALLELGRPAEALESFSLAGGGDDALLGAAKSLVSLGRDAGALEALGRMSAAGRASPAAIVESGLAQSGLGELEAALASFERAISLGPGSAYAHACRAEALIALGRPHEALEAAGIAVSLDGALRAAAEARGHALEVLGWDGDEGVRRGAD